MVIGRHQCQGFSSFLFFRLVRVRALVAVWQPVTCYWIARSSTSKISVSFGPMVMPDPASP